MTEIISKVTNNFSTTIEYDGIEMSIEKLSKAFALPLNMSPREVDHFIPKASKDPAFLAAVEDEIAQIPTEHRLILGDARKMESIDDNSVHLVVTSPPYWTLKEYNKSEGQLGYVADYEEFLKELDKVWSECNRVLVEGGRLIVVVGDVCLSRRKHKRHQVFPLHAEVIRQPIQRKQGRLVLSFDDVVDSGWAEARFHR